MLHGFCFELADSESGSAENRPVSATMQKRWSRPSMSSLARAVRRQTLFLGVVPNLLRVVLSDNVDTGELRAGNPWRSVSAATGSGVLPAWMLRPSEWRSLPREVPVRETSRELSRRTGRADWAWLQPPRLVVTGAALSITCRWLLSARKVIA